MQGRIAVKRVYEPVTDSDGVRVLVDRLWPRGISKREARIGLWARELAPSTELRRWFKHDPTRWDEFRRQYFEELDAKPAQLKELVAAIAYARVTLVFSAREETFNNARAFREYLETRGLID